MSTIVRSVVVAASLALSMVGLALPGVAADDSGSWVSVDQVLVNRLGGVSVVGSVDCSAVYADLTDSDGIMVLVDEETDTWEPLIVDPDTQWVNIYANSDNYTVSQPAGRKTMLQATHESSRMNPCFKQAEFVGGAGPSCDPSGAPCVWVTDRYGYAGSAPLFDYASNGRFKTGNVDVAVNSIGTMIEVVDRADTSIRNYYWAGNLFEVTNQQIVRAVAYR